MFQPIVEFLNRFKKLAPPDEVVRLSLAQAIEKITEIQIPPNKISVRRDIAFVGTEHPSIKSEILLKKEEILLFLKQQLNRDLLRDIR